MTDAVDLVLQAEDCIAVLTRVVTVRLLDISGSGCLLEADTRLREGLVGRLRLVVNSVEYVDDVRIVRCTAVEGGQGWRVGVEFLWTTSPGDRSLRRLTARLQAAVVLRGDDELRGRM
jgi:hypothetical protein